MKSGTLTLGLATGALACAVTLATAIADPPAPPEGDTPPAAPANPEAAPAVPASVAARMAARPGSGSSRGDLPSFDVVGKDYTKVISTTDGKGNLYTLWTRKKDGQILAELPRSFEKKKIFIGCTVAGGIPTAGVQYSDMYAYWKRFDKRLALIQPNFAVRSSGDFESKKGHDRVFTDRVILDVPIAAMGPGGGPVIDLDDLLLGQASKFFGFQGMGINRRLATIAKAKAFPENVEVAFEAPMSGGQFTTLHYSIRSIPDNTGYTPRKADERIGYFTTAYRDIGDPSADSPWVRYINRWKLEKADAKLKMSPPKEPIVFYLEHTIPVRYRKWVREAVLEWNKAYEKVGIVNAIEVYQQDAKTGAHMEKDPEDARYNFLLWTNAGMGFAIGPSRVHPLTGQILDADIVMDEGFITGWVNTWRKLIPQTAMENFGPETLAWLESRPKWDPRVRLAAPAERPEVMQRIAMARSNRGVARFGGHPAAMADATIMGDQVYDGLSGRQSQMNGACVNAMMKSFEISFMRMAPYLLDELASRGVITASRAAPVALGADDGVSGTWTGTLKGGEDLGMPPEGMAFVLTLEMDGTSVYGSMEVNGSAAELTDGTYDPETGALTARVRDPDAGISANLDAKIKGENITGTITVEGMPLTLNLSGERTEVADTSDDSGPVIGNAAGTADEAVPEEPPADEETEEKTDEETPETEEADEEPVVPSDLLDGIPDWFIGPLLREVIMHEVGHTLGLRHNFKGSTIYDLAEVNVDGIKGQANSGSVMDYLPININVDEKAVQGDYTIVTVGPYDYWAIEYGYTTARDLKPILARVNEPQLAFATDEDTWGPDPRARRFDFAKNPLDYADAQVDLVKILRADIMEKMVKDGESWAKARQAYDNLLGKQFGAVSIAANWIGGAYLNRDKKGDPGDRAPVAPIDAKQQRRAMQIVIENTFRDEAYGLTPELLSHMTVDKWWDDGGMGAIFEDETWPVHERIAGLQAAALTMLLNPGTLGRVHDNEFRTGSENAFTVADIMFDLTDEVWSELEGTGPTKISSLRRNLQREHLDRLIDLSLPGAGFGAAGQTVSNLSVHLLRDVKGRIDKSLEPKGRLDRYVVAHLSEASILIDKALDAQYIYNADDMGGGGGGRPFIIMQPESDDR